MNPRMKTLSFAVLQVFGVGVAMTVLSAPANAQQTAQTRERIEVTGSNIKRVEGETALPVTVISKEEIQNTGVQTAQDLLDRLSANQSFGGFTEHRGGKNTRYNASVGVGDLSRDRWNIYFTADYLKQDPLKASARPISHTAYIPDLGIDRTSGNSLPANISQPGGFSGTRNPTIP